jgi:hypothetical protein
MPKVYEFTKTTTVTVVLDNDCDCTGDCDSCVGKAWDKFDAEDGTIDAKPIIWEII